MTLQKLVHSYDPEDSGDESYESDAETAGDASEGGTRKGQRRKDFAARLQRIFRSKKWKTTELGSGDQASAGGFESRLKTQPTGFSDLPDPNELRTLQRYHAAPNDPRTVFMEKHSSLSSKRLAVACEQVSMFITQNNTIISFFELSAQDVEAPIIRRLQTSDTIIRQYVLTYAHTRGF